MGRVEVIPGEGLNGKFARVCEIAVRAQICSLEKKNGRLKFCGCSFF
jgi:hypothetical protein